MKIVLFLGSPGTGKGSLSHMLVERHGFVHLSTGKIFRANKTKIINSGALVSDDIVNELVLNEINSIQERDPNAKVILDGFPRTIVQAEFLRAHHPVDRVFHLTNISDEFIIKRLENRLLCEKEDHSFNLVYNPPKVEGVCDHDGSRLYRRPDDEGEIIQKRLNTYRELTQPLIDYYRKQGNLVDLNASKNSEEIMVELVDCIREEFLS